MSDRRCGRKRMELAVSDALEDISRVDGLWRMRVDGKTILAPLSTDEVAEIVVNRIMDLD